MEYKPTELYLQLRRLGCEESSLRKRHEIALRIGRRGYDPRIVYELSQAGLDKLEKRLARAEENERLHQKTLESWIRYLLGKGKIQSPLRFDDLPKDRQLVLMVGIVNKESELDELTNQLKKIENQRQYVMGYEDSEDQIANLDSDWANLEKKRRCIQEELTRLKTNLGT